MSAADHVMLRHSTHRVFHRYTETTPLEDCGVLLLLRLQPPTCFVLIVLRVCYVYGKISSTICISDFCTY